MVWKLYMREEPPYAYDEERAARTQPIVRSMVVAAYDAARKLYG
jgi:hypothetical protein